MKPVPVSGSSEAADGLVRATVGDTGEVLELDIEPKAMRLPSDELAAAVRTAITAARADARTQRGAAAGQPAELRAELDRIGGEAEDSIAALGNLARELSARLDRM